MTQGQLTITSSSLCLLCLFAAVVFVLRCGDSVEFNHGFNGNS
jgi:hypothetical protein